MIGKSFRLSKGMLFALLLGLGIALLLSPRSITQKMNFLFARAFGPLIGLGREFKIKNAVMPGQDAQVVPRDEHNRLWKNYKNLHAQLYKLQSDYEALARIRSGLPNFYSGLIIASVTRQTAGLSQELLINKGSADGVRRDSYVMGPDYNSIIGVVRETSDQVARVLLLTDANQSIEVRIRCDGTRQDIGALMTGNGKRGGTISMIERDKGVKAGDAVYAAPRPGQLEVPMIIGQVSGVEPDENAPLLCRISVELADNAFDLNTVAVIIPDMFESEKR
jgi:cell shape-determining protein MreC